MGPNAFTCMLLSHSLSKMLEVLEGTISRVFVYEGTLEGCNRPSEVFERNPLKLADASQSICPSATDRMKDVLFLLSVPPPFSRLCPQRISTITSCIHHCQHIPEHFAQFAISSGLVTELGLGLRPRKANLETAKPFLEQKPVLVADSRDLPTATILGGPELYVGAGSTINLTCAIHFSSEPPAYIFWYYNNNVLSYDSPRGGISVITEKGGDITTSWLLMQAAQPSDSGEYSCKPSNANTASVKVHVLHGKCLRRNAAPSIVAI
ncbi:hypothetical protein HZH68_015608 [Vespula germanica]|uniref:Ig-like domain-containing protein n=1 Tax=Vespula germanica TaxID=30212 RepID=A0A834MQU0_VESGE|nr:hypothetical protein HZH68_015608 [Vespula germanica]